MRIHTCRFCKETIWPSDLMVHYSTRHNAHPECYLKAGKSLYDLNRFAVNNLPYMLLKKYNLLEQAREITKDIPKDIWAIAGKAGMKDSPGAHMN